MVEMGATSLACDRGTGMMDGDPRAGLTATPDR